MGEVHESLWARVREREMERNGERGRGDWERLGKRERWKKAERRVALRKA
jgi:hypothetical protein